jgi:hypothetical protein
MDRPALDTWLKQQKDEQRKKRIARSLAAENNRISKIIGMYSVYGSNETALVNQKDNTNHLQVWNRDFAKKRQERQIEELK